MIVLIFSFDARLGILCAGSRTFASPQTRILRLDHDLDVADTFRIPRALPHHTLPKVLVHELVCEVTSCNLGGGLTAS